MNTTVPPRAHPSWTVAIERRTNEIIDAQFKREAAKDPRLIQALKTVSRAVYTNCLRAWTEQRAKPRSATETGSAKDTTTDERPVAKRPKFVMPKDKDITIAACLVCAIYSTNSESFYPVFPLDAIRHVYAYANYQTGSSWPENRSHGLSKFKKRVFEFVSSIQEEELTEIHFNGATHVPVFDYGLLVQRVLVHEGEMTKEASAFAVRLFVDLVRFVRFDGKSPMFVCLLVLHHVSDKKERGECACSFSISHRGAVAISELVARQIEFANLSRSVLDEYHSHLKQHHHRCHGERAANSM